MFLYKKQFHSFRRTVGEEMCDSPGVPKHHGVSSDLHREYGDLAHNVKHQVNQRYLKYKAMSDYLLEHEKEYKEEMSKDFMYLLFFESHRGNLLHHFQYIKTFIFDSYLYPKSSPPKDSRDHSINHDGEEEEEEDDFDMTGLDASNRENNSVFENLSLDVHLATFAEAKKRKRRGAYVERNESYIRLMLSTLSCVEDRVELEEYLNYIANVSNAKFANIDGGQGDTTTMSAEEKELHELMDKLTEREMSLLDKKTMANMNITKYLTSCNWCYFHLRYFTLVSIAIDADISEYIGSKCDRGKFRNFPLYLGILLEDIENKPFNNITSSQIISDFLEDSMNYYFSGIVHPKHMSKFFNHPRYLRSNC